MPSDITWKRIGDELWLRLTDGLVMACRDIKRDRGEGGYRANFLATEEATGLVAWGDVRLAGATSRAAFLKNLRDVGIEPPTASRLSDVCLLIDRIQRDGAEPVIMVPRKPSADSWLVPRWMPLRGTTVLYGHGGTGKSLLVLYFGVCALTGRKCGPWEIAPVKRVLYLDWEEPEAAPHEERLYGILGPGGFPDLGDRMLHRTMDCSLADGIERIRILVDRYEIDLVIVDSLHVASGREIEGADAARASLDALRTLRGCSKLVVGHVPWAGVGQPVGIPKLYGSVFNENLARSTIYVGEQPLATDRKILTAHRHKGNRGGAPAPVGFHLAFSDDPNATDVIITAHAPDLSQASHGDRIVDFLRHCPGNKAPVTRIADETGIPKPTVKTTLQRMKGNRVVNISVTNEEGDQKSEWGLINRRDNIQAG